MDSVEVFLAYSIKLEEEAALRFGQLADAMMSAGNPEVGKLFRRLAEYSRLHMTRTAGGRAGPASNTVSVFVPVPGEQPGR